MGSPGSHLEREERQNKELLESLERGERALGTPSPGTCIPKATSLFPSHPPNWMRVTPTLTSSSPLANPASKAESKAESWVLRLQT